MIVYSRSIRAEFDASGMIKVNIFPRIPAHISIDTWQNTSVQVRIIEILYERGLLMVLLFQGLHMPETKGAI